MDRQPGLAVIENLSRASFRTFRRGKVESCHFVAAEKWEISPFRLEKDANPIIGKNTPRTMAGMSTAYVYFIADPRTPRHPRYVGHTENPESRAHSHAKATANNNYPFGDWKKSLKADGLAAVFVIVAAYPSRLEAREAEWRLIRRWQRRGLCDFNIERGNWDATKLEWAGLRASGVLP